MITPFSPSCFWLLLYLATVHTVGHFDCFWGIFVESTVLSNVVDPCFNGSDALCLLHTAIINASMSFIPAFSYDFTMSAICRWYNPWRSLFYHGISISWSFSMSVTVDAFHSFSSSSFDAILLIDIFLNVWNFVQDSSFPKPHPFFPTST